MKVIHVQPALPRYRVDFFERLASLFGEDFRLYYSTADMGGLTSGIATHRWSTCLGSIKPLCAGLYWQSGICSVAVNRGDVVVLSGNPRYLSTLYLMFRSRLRGAKVIWWGHLWSSTSKSWRFKGRLWLMQYSDALLFYTDSEVEEYRRQTGDGGKVVVGLNNGLHLAPVRRFRSDYVASERPISLLFIGRLTKKARVELLLRALHHLGHCAPHLHVVGDGSERDGLKSLSVTLGLGDCITWHGDVTEESAIAEVANRCQAFVYPGEVGLSLIHAMMYGLPAIVHDSRRSHMPEIAAFIPGETGTTFRMGDAADLASAINFALGCESQLASWSQAAVERTRGTFNTEDMADRFSAAVKNLTI
jgi:glycosyltransferase involved in cell wall biosynthesis